MKTVRQTSQVQAMENAAVNHPGSVGGSVARWLESEEFTEIDRHFARLMERLCGVPNSEVTMAAALASRSQRQGSICLDLRTVAGTIFPNAPTLSDGRLQLPALESWVGALRKAPVVGRPSEFKPLVLDEHGRLYLHRYWEYESDLAKGILHRAEQEAEGVNRSLLEEGLARLFPAASPSGDTDWQRVAASTAARKKFCIISGGPGTGKTRTVVGVLVLLLEQAGGKPLRIALAAPTGKAAARLEESLKTLKTALPCADAIKARLPEETFTLHRLLGGVPGSARFKYNADNPLPFDVVVVDEASMVDLALMAKLFHAIPSAARAVLLGDKDQLASVEAGAVLGDICAGAEEAADRSCARQSVASFSTPPSGDGGYAAADLPPLAECIVQLQKNYRFGADNGILALSQAINKGDAERAVSLLKASSSLVRPHPQKRESTRLASVEVSCGEGIAAVTLPSPERLKDQLREPVLTGFGELLRTRDPLTALKAQGRFRVLCALRQGPYGVETLNRLAEEILAEAQLIPARECWYSGRPVMVTRNDYHLKLFNGDVGFILPDASSGEARAWFLGADNTLRSVPPIRLPEHETVFAMTVHKSQGSEFEQVLLVLPDRDSPVLTRELLYTGVTRASRRVEVWFNEPVFRAAVTRQVERASGLRDALWGQSMVMSSQQH